MPSFAANHPQVVHFAIALVFVGVALRLISLTGRWRFTNHSATLLLVLATLATVASVKSGVDAHGPVERIPGVRAAVIEHEELGETTRNVLFGVAALELLALGLMAGASTARFAKAAYVASAVVGVWAAVSMYEAAEHGGELVYSYAGGPGLRTGDAVDVERLLLAGLYNQSVADRRAGRADDAARLVAEMVTRFPGDTTIKFLLVESLLSDKSDPAAALAAARALTVDTTVARWRTRKATITTDIFLALGQPDSARATLAPIVAAFPQNARLKAKLDSIK